MNDNTTTTNDDLKDDAALDGDIRTADDGVDDVDHYDDQPHHDDSGDHAAHHEVDDHEERSSSLAGRLLTYLVVLIAGAALALWGGPKLAPQLPQWAAPAAKYLTPGGDAALREVTALRGDVDARLAEIPAIPDSAAIAAEVEGGLAARIDAIETGLTAKITALGDQVNATDGGAIEARLAQLESRLEGVSAELASLSEAVSTATIDGGGMTEEALIALSANASKISGLRAELDAVAAQNGTLAQRIDDVEATADRKVAEAEETVAEATAEAAALAAEKARQERLGALIAAAKGGTPFASELAAATEGGITVPEGLSQAAETGIKSIAALRSDLSPLAHQAIRATIKSEAAEDGGTMSKFTAFLASQVATRSLKPTEGNSTDAILSRIENALGQDDLTTVLTEADSLAPAAKTVLDPWLTQVTARRDVLSALETLGASAS